MAKPVEVKFRRKDDESGEFDHGRGYDGAYDKLDNLINRHQSRRISDQEYIDGLTVLIERRPSFIDARVHLGNLVFERAGPARAYNHYWEAYKIGLAALPIGYLDQIRWSDHDNRPFLRAAHGMVACCRRDSSYIVAIDVMERMLRWNPDDNQGIRFQIGSICLRAGRRETARGHLAANAAVHSPLFYDLALLHFEQGDLIEAATSLRRGFAGNDYVAEILNGCVKPISLPIRNARSDMSMESARDYVDVYGKRWADTEDALLFLRVVHSHSGVMKERAAFREFDELITRSPSDHYARESRRDLLAGIDDELSRMAIELFRPSQKSATSFRGGAMTAPLRP